MSETVSHDNSYQYFLLNRCGSCRLLFCCCSQESSIQLHQESLPVELVVAASVLLKKYEYESVSSEWRLRCVKCWNFQSSRVGWMHSVLQLLSTVPLTLRAACCREKRLAPSAGCVIACGMVWAPSDRAGDGSSRLACPRGAAVLKFAAGASVQMWHCHFKAWGNIMSQFLKLKLAFKFRVKENVPRLYTLSILNNFQLLSVD